MGYRKYNNIVAEEIGNPMEMAVWFLVAWLSLPNYDTMPITALPFRTLAGCERAINKLERFSHRWEGVCIPGDAGKNYWNLPEEARK
jgi:hypothetical protein